MPAATTTEPLPAPSDELDSLFQRYHGKIFAAAYRVTGRAQDAEDVLQTVFLRLLKRQHDIDLDPSPSAYLHRAAVNASLDLIRARGRSQSIPLDELGSQPVGSSGDDPERRQQDRELRRGVRQAILGLSEKSAEVFTLRFLEGVPNQEIAEMLGMTQTSVGVTLHRARNQVKKEIRSFVGDS